MEGQSDHALQVVVAGGVGDGRGEVGGGLESQIKARSRRSWADKSLVLALVRCM